MTRAEYRVYKISWRKRHPHYERDLMRAKRGLIPGGENLIRGRSANRRIILGVPVDVVRFGEILRSL